MFRSYQNRACRKFYALKNQILLSVLSNAQGILHIGAHTGQEAITYNSLDLEVIWVEANPEIFSKLEKNIADFENQTAIQALLGAENKEVQFNISSNDGLSSSIFLFGKDMPNSNLQMIRAQNLSMSRLDFLFRERDLRFFKHWIVDCQGQELGVLQGAGKLLHQADSLQIEVSTREEYQGGTDYGELVSFLRAQGFYPLWTPEENSHEDILFLKNRSVRKSMTA